MSEYPDLTHMMARPDSAECDMRIIGLKIRSVGRDSGTINIDFYVDEAKGFMNVDGAGMVKVDHFDTFAITLPFDPKVDPQNHDRMLDLYCDQLDKWREDGSSLRMFAEPGYWSVLMSSTSDWLPIPRDSGVRQ